MIQYLVDGMVYDAVLGRFVSQRDQHVNSDLDITLVLPFIDLIGNSLFFFNWRGNCGTAKLFTRFACRTTLVRDVLNVFGFSVCPAVSLVNGLAALWLGGQLSKINPRFYRRDCPPGEFCDLRPKPVVDSKSATIGPYCFDWVRLAGGVCRYCVDVYIEIEATTHLGWCRKRLAMAPCEPEETEAKETPESGRPL